MKKKRKSPFKKVVSFILEIIPTLAFILFMSVAVSMVSSLFLTMQMEQISREKIKDPLISFSKFCMEHGYDGRWSFRLYDTEHENIEGKFTCIGERRRAYDHKILEVETSSGGSIRLQ